MFMELLKDDSLKRIIEEINKSGYSVNQIASYSHLGVNEVRRLVDGEIDEMDFMMLVGLCRTMHLNPFSFIKDDVKLTEFLNSI